MKLNRKAVIINAAVLLILLLCAEFAAWLTLFIKGNAYILKNGYQKKEDGLRFPKYRLKPTTWTEKYTQSNFRPVHGLEYKKRPVVIFGCSYAYGYGLQNEQTFDYKLSSLTRRPVYNRAYQRWGIQHMLWQLQNEPKLDEIKDPEYVIFVYMNDHLYRLRTDYFNPNEAIWVDANYPYLTYVEKNGRLEIKKHPFSFVYNSYFADNLIYLAGRRKYNSAEKNDDEAKKLGELVKLHFLESKKLIDEKWPGAKPVVLTYNNYWYTTLGTACGLDYIWDDLVKEGFIILDASQITGKTLSKEKYKFYDGHPNEAAWDAIVPALVKKLGL